MRIAIMLLLGWLVLASNSPGSETAAPTEPVYVCRHPHGTAQLGEAICLAVQGRRQLARCEKVLNNTSWRFLGIECDLPPSMKGGASPLAP